MTESNGRIALRALWGVILTLAAPGLGLIYTGLWWTGLALLVIDDALSLAALAVTRTYAPSPSPFQAILAILATAILFRLVAIVIVVRRLRRAAMARNRWRRSAWLAAALLAAASVAQDAALPPFGWRSFSVPSGSMIPTLEIGDIFLADIRTPGIRPPQGDVIVFTARDPAQTIFVKRVIGLSGDQIAVRQGHLTINGRPTPLRAEPGVMTEDGEARRYVETLPNGRDYAMQKLTDDGPMNDTPGYIVPPGNMFLMGDNRDNSMDSRALALRNGATFGFVPVPDILGTASMLFWPPARAFKMVR